MSGCHYNHSPDCSHISYWIKGLMIVLTLSLLKASSNKTSFITLNRSIRFGLNFEHPFACDRNCMRWLRNNIPSTCTVKSSKLFCHSMLPLRNTSSFLVIGWFCDDRTNARISQSIYRWYSGMISKMIGPINLQLIRIISIIKNSSVRTGRGVGNRCSLCLSSGTTGR
jgi:hypothetical protein